MLQNFLAVTPKLTITPFFDHNKSREYMLVLCLTSNTAPKVHQWFNYPILSIQ